MEFFFSKVAFRSGAWYGSFKSYKYFISFILKFTFSQILYLYLILRKFAWSSSFSFWIFLWFNTRGIIYTIIFFQLIHFRFCSFLNLNRFSFFDQVIVLLVSFSISSIHNHTLSLSLLTTIMHTTFFFFASMIAISSYLKSKHFERNGSSLLIFKGSGKSISSTSNI